MNYQEMLLRLLTFWSERGCVVSHAYSGEVGAGTFNPMTFFRALGPEPWRAVNIEPSKRPVDARYGENPNRLYSHNQGQVILKPAPADIQDQYLESLSAFGIDAARHDIRFVEDDWESPSLGAWGLGWEVWCDGMEITQFTYFQQMGGHECDPVTGELTYGSERIAMYVQDVDDVMDLAYAPGVTYGEIYKRAEREWSTYAFKASSPELLLRLFDDLEAESERLLAEGLLLPAYDFLVKCNHTFNVLDARGAISVAERQRYMGRIRTMARACADAWVAERERIGFPLLTPVG